MPYRVPDLGTCGGQTQELNSGQTSLLHAHVVQYGAVYAEDKEKVVNSHAYADIHH